MVRRLVITGAGGFLGRALVRALGDSGWQVTALGRDADVVQPEALFQRARPAEALVHLAFVADPLRRRADPVRAIQVASGGTSNAVRLALACGASHLVLASSGKVYGRSPCLPSTEDDPIRPTTFLGRLKALQEEIVLLAASQQLTWAGTALRIFNVYGPEAPDGYLLPKLLGSLRAGQTVALGELDHRRDWVHLEDVCAAFAVALENPPKPGSFRALNVGSGQSLSAREWVEIFARVSGHRLGVRLDTTALRPEEPQEERADWRRIAELGWRPRIDPEAGARGIWSADHGGR